MRKLVLTLTVGDAHWRMADVTHPTHKAYAERVGAQFAVISEVKHGWKPHWGKCAMYDLLGHDWDRIIYIDTDAIIRPDCPDLFEVVPEENFGAFNEGKFLPRQEFVAEGVRQYCDKPLGWDGLYFNSGVMVSSRRHRQLFRPPEREPAPILWEQTFLNILRIVENIPTQDIKPEFNYMPSLQSLTGYPMGNAYIAHFAGTPAPLAEQMAREQIAEWEANPDYSYKRRIWLDFGGGLGDVIDAEPVLRYARERVFPRDDIRVTTPWPRVFQPCDLPLSYAAVSPFGDDPCVKLQTVPDRLGEGVLQVLTHVSSNATDFASIGMLHQQLPLDQKRTRLQVLPEDEAEVNELAGEFALDRAVLIHPGRTWDSRTFPVEWWQEIINGIAAECPVALMGLNGEIHGVLPVECPENGLDLRDRTSMGAMFELVRRCPCLVTNDSSPVHAAGAFDNYIVLIPSARQPDFVLPWRRNKTPYWRATALYKRLTIDDIDCHPLDYYGTHANGFEGDWKDYLPDAKDVIAAALRGRSEVLNGNEKLCVAGGDAAMGGGEAGIEPGNGHKRNGRRKAGEQAKAAALAGKS